MFLVNNYPNPATELIKSRTKIYPYEPGGSGTSMAEFLSGDAKLARITPPPPTVFHEGSGVVMNTIPPNDYSFYEMLNAVVQQEPATVLDPELMGPLAAIGIIKGKPCAPDDRMKKILTEALALANATSRGLFMKPRDPDWYYYTGSAWWNMLFVSGYEFETPIPLITPDGAKPFPPTGYRTLNARTSFFYGVTGITPAMAMRVTGVGSQYLLAFLDAEKNFFDGAKTYKVTLPKGIPAEKFWSLTLYDNQTRSMLDTPQRYPRAGSQSVTGDATERRRFNDGLLRSRAASECPARELDTDHARQRLVHNPAPLQSTRTLLYKGVAAERDRTGEIAHQCRRLLALLGPREMSDLSPQSGPKRTLNQHCRMTGRDPQQS